MILYQAKRDNGAAEPWRLENYWVFEIRFDLRAWLVGASYADRCLTVHCGPLYLNWWRAER